MRYWSRKPVQVNDSKPNYKDARILFYLSLFMLAIAVGAAIAVAILDLPLLPLVLFGGAGFFLVPFIASVIEWHSEYEKEKKNKIKIQAATVSDKPPTLPKEKKWLPSTEKDKTVDELGSQGDLMLDELQCKR